MSSRKTITLNLDTDREKMKKAQDIVDKYQQKLKEANALADELASLNLNIKFLN